MDRKIQALGILGLTALASGPALAQPAPAPGAKPAAATEEVVVTARRRQETLQDIPLSISALSSAEIKSARIERLADVARLTPGLNYTPLFGAQNQLPIIRGAAQTFGQLNVGVFLDGIYLSGKAGVDLEMSDLARVEVVKGPQSALYGRNTFAGAINYITRRPSDVLSGGVEMTGGEHGLFKTVASLEGGLSSNVRARVSFYNRDFDGWYKSAIDGGKVDFSHVWGASGVLELQPLDAFTATFRVSGGKEESGQPPSTLVRTNAFSGSPAGSTIPGVFSTKRNLLYVGALPEVPSDGVYVNTVRSGYELNDYGQSVNNIRSSLDLRYETSMANFAAITSYAHRTDTYQFDGDNTICDGAVNCPSFGYPFAPAIPKGATNFNLSSAHENFRDVSQEFRVSSPEGRALHWLLGVYYYDNKTTNLGENLTTAYPYSGKTAAFYGSPYIATTTNGVSEFASLSYTIANALTLTGEVRHEDESQTYFQAPLNPACATSTDTTCITFNAPSVLTKGATLTLPELKFSFVTPRFIADYKWAPTNSVYVSVAKGEKTGGFNSALNISAGNRTYTPEESWNYEIGSKNQFFNRALLINVAAYYTDWSKQQVPCQEPGTASSTNRTYICTAGQSAIYGLELEGTWRITEQVSLGGNYTYTHARYKAFKDDTLNATLAILGLPAFNFDGKRLPYVPEQKIVLIPRYETRIFGSWDLEARANVSYQSRTYVRADNLQWMKDKTVVDLRVGLERGSWRVQAFVDNVFDNKAPVAAVRFFDLVNYFVAAPLVTGADRRLGGVSVGYKF